MNTKRSAVILAIMAGAAATPPVFAQTAPSLTIRPPVTRLHRHGDRRTVASPNVPVADEAEDSVDGPDAHGNCSTAGGGSGAAAMAASNC